MVDEMVEKLDSVSERQIKELNKNADPTRSMMASLLTQQYFQRAASLALTIEEEFKNAGRISREAKQRPKGIWVLQAVAMPDVLVETGFLSILRIIKPSEIPTFGKRSPSSFLISTPELMPNAFLVSLDIVDNSASNSFEITLDETSFLESLVLPF
jgi:hypothetical protein